MKENITEKDLQEISKNILLNDLIHSITSRLLAINPNEEQFESFINKVKDSMCREKFLTGEEKHELFFDKESARKTEVLSGEQLTGLSSVKIAILLYHLVSSGTGKNSDEIFEIGRMLSTVAVQPNRL